MSAPGWIVSGIFVGIFMAAEAASWYERWRNR